jgi:hypothetical protein
MSLKLQTRSDVVKNQPLLQGRAKRKIGELLQACVHLHGIGDLGDEADWLLDLNIATIIVHELQGKYFKKTRYHYVSGVCATEAVVSVMVNKAKFTPIAQSEHAVLFSRDGQSAWIEVREDDFSQVTSLGIVVMTPKQNQVEAMLKELEAVIRKHFSLIESERIRVNYIHATERGGVDSETFHTIITEKFHDEAYPSFNDPLGFIQQYLNADESSLLLHGNPGTGKTRFVRWIVAEASKKWKDLCVHYAQTEAVLKSDDLFIGFMRDKKARILVLEDVDLNLMPRKDGNVIMPKFLALTDGLIRPLEHKKVIFTANQTIHSIDEALTRAGRTFAAVNFEKLTRQQADKFLHAIGVNAKLADGDYSLAELYRLARNGSNGANQQGEPQP